MAANDTDQHQENAQQPHTERPDLLNNPQLFALLISKIDEQIHKRLQSRIESFRAWFLGVTTVLLLGAGFLGTLFVESFVDSKVRAAAEIAGKKGANDVLNSPELKDLQNAVEQARYDSRVATLNLRVLNIDISDSFGEEEAQSIVEELTELYMAYPGVQKFDSLDFASATAAKNFAAIGRLDLVDQIYNLEPDVFDKDKDFVPLMTRVYGNRLLAAAGGPRSWMEDGGPMSETHSQYRKYADRAKLVGYPELYHLYELLLRHIEGRDVGELSNITRDIDALNDGDARVFIAVASRLATDPPTDSDPEAERIMGRVRSLLCEFRSDSNRLNAVIMATKISC